MSSKSTCTDESSKYEARTESEDVEQSNLYAKRSNQESQGHASSEENKQPISTSKASSKETISSPHYPSSSDTKSSSFDDMSALPNKSTLISSIRRKPKLKGAENEDLGYNIDPRRRVYIKHTIKSVQKGV
ncbi:hypothetical protein CFOL_v3_13943 [Cephalotus follicularis]|uniref:Uncharacterized protein n=1 Tax=Cephalotus follicularis TaxID=3775 RepID=A0A1Q3BR71_CEPFO|nr:hypothetical protein CFOL_v3_13943 [Cephalotus follicularis]